ncbi:MAG: type I 3-dehydroquinate dehydratase [Candidatus Bathyarchaeia archaeon]
MKPRICVSIMPKTMTEFETLWIDALKSEPDYIEVRLDHLNEPVKFKEPSWKNGIIKIATDRFKCEDAERSLCEERFRNLIRTSNEGFDYVDLEVSTDNIKAKVENLRECGVKIILSHHDWKRTPEVKELKNILKNMSKIGADAYKIVTTARRLEDNLSTLNFLSQASRRFKIVCFAMGELGKISRIMSPMFGGLFTVASLKHGGETAPGQIPIDDLKIIYEKISLKLEE